MIDAIRKAALGAIEAGAPVAVMFGQVAAVNPLEVNVDQRFTLDADFLVLPESLSQRGLDKGDRLILLRAQGGQQYVILDKVAST